MNTTPQITINAVPVGIAVSSPFNSKNNEVFKGLHGRFDPPGRRWILPPTAESKAKIAELFGEDSPDVVARVMARDLKICDNQLVLSGYVVAGLDERTNSIRMQAGVEIATGAWDDVASREHHHPCMAGSDFSVKVVVRQNFAETHGLKIEEFLGYRQVRNPLQIFSDSDLQAELESRGFRVEKNPPQKNPPQSLF